MINFSRGICVIALPGANPLMREGQRRNGENYGGT